MNFDRLRKVLWTLRYGNRYALSIPRLVAALPAVGFICLEVMQARQCWEWAHQDLTLGGTVKAGLLLVLMSYVYPAVIVGLFRGQR